MMGALYGVVAMSLLRGIVAGPQVLGPGAGGDTIPASLVREGPHPVETSAAVVIQAPDHRPIPLRIYWPRTAGRYPLIVFSHGAGGSRDGYGTLSRFWASHGYICLHPTHADSLALRDDRTAPPAVLRGLLRRTIGNAVAWQQRFADIVTILDNLRFIETEVPALRERIDHEAIGVAGHSFGAGTAMYAGGVTVQLPGARKPVTFRDARVRCILVLSGQGVGQLGFTPRSWSDLRLPAMFVTGSRDRGSGGQSPAWRLEPYQYAPDGDKFALYIEGANHLSYSGRPVGTAASPPQMLMGASLVRPADQSQIFGYVKIASLAFWNAYLRHDAQARRLLQSESLVEYSRNAVRMTYK